jgi:hypothetical protein
VISSLGSINALRDFEQSAAQANDWASLSLLDGPSPDVFLIDEHEPQGFVKPTNLFRPLHLNRKVTVQPLLTPDKYPEHALALIRSARKSVWFQNQYINFRGADEDFAEFN